MNNVRPDLVLSDWQASYDAKGGTIRIRGIQNIGQGPAFFIRPYLFVPGKDAQPDCGFMPTTPVGVLPKADSHRIDWWGRFSWSCGITPSAGYTLVPLRLVLYYTDDWPVA